MEQQSEIRDIPPREPLSLDERQVKYVIVAAIAAVVVLLIALLTAIFAVRSARQANRKIDTLSQELDAATESTRQLLEKYDALQTSYTTMSEEFTALKEEHENLQKQYAELEKAYEKLQEEYDAKVEENNNLKEEAEAAELAEEVEAMENEVCGTYRPKTVMGLSMKMAQIVYRVQGGKGILSEMYAVELERGGVGTFLNDGEEVAITWRMDGDHLYLETEDMYSDTIYANGTITMTVDDMEVVLAKEE